MMIDKIFGIEGTFDYHDGWLRVGRRWFGVYNRRVRVVPAIMGGTSASTTQEAFWFRNDNGSLTTATYIGSQDTNYSTGDLTANYKFRIRIIVEEQNGKNDPWAFQLGAQKNGTGGYTLITTTRTDGIRYADDANSIADGTTISTADFDLTYTGTPTDGEYDDAQTSAGTSTISLNGTYTEVEFCLEAVFADYNDTDYFDFQVLSTGGGALNGYTVTPRITLNKGATTHTGAATLNAVGTLTAAGALVWAGEQVSVDLETGDLTQFDTTTNPTDMSATGAAAQNGSYGLQVDLTSAGGVDTHGNMTLPIGLSSNNQINMRIYIDDNTLSLGVGDTLDMAVLRTDGTVGGVSQMGRISIRNNSGTIQLQGLHETDAGATGSVTASSPAFPLYAEIELKRASSDVAADGTLELFINGVTAGTDTRDNYDIFPTLSGSRMGADSNQATTTGVLYLDDFVVSNTYIGAVSTGLNSGATLNAVATQTSVGAVTRIGATTMNATATFTASGSYLHQAQSTMSAVATMTANGSLLHQATSTLAAQATLSGAPSITRAVTSTLNAIATLSGVPTATPALNSGAVLNAIVTTTNVASLTIVSGAQLNNVVTLTAIGAISGAQNSGAILNAIASLTSAPSVTRPGATVMNVVATLSGTGSTSTIVNSGAVLNAPATLTGTPTATPALTSGAVLNATATMTSAPAVVRATGAILSAQVTTTAQGVLIHVSGAVLTAQATMTASGSILGTVTAVASLNAIVTMTSSPAVTRSSSTAMSAQASLTAIAQNLKNASASMTASSTTTPTAAVIIAAILALTGIATLSGRGVYHYDVVYPNPDNVVFLTFRDKRTYVNFRDKRKTVR